MLIINDKTFLSIKLLIQVQTLEMLLQAYDNEDAESARSALNSPFIKHMDVEYAKLARGLPLPQQEYAVPPVGVRANAAPSYISPNANKLTGQATVEAEVNHVSQDLLFECNMKIKSFKVAIKERSIHDFDLKHFRKNSLYLLLKRRNLINPSQLSPCLNQNQNQNLYKPLKLNHLLKQVHHLLQQ